MKKAYRAQALTLLCEFVQSQPPHLHVVLETHLFENILRCLQLDTSTTVVTLAVTALTMLLPNVPSSLVPHLPVLFNIYARLLFWDRERSLAADNPTLEPSSTPSEAATDWETCAFSPDVDSPSIPNLLSYFTILYGLYPLNFVDYIRKPQRYLRHADDPNADAIEVQPSEIRQKSERFRQYHVLHPNFYSLTVESEKTDLGRWIKSEASEVVAECTALCMATEFNSGPELEEHGRAATRMLDQPFLSSSSFTRDPIWRTSTIGGSSDDSRVLFRRHSHSSHAPSMRETLQSSRIREPAPGESPTLPASLVLSTSHTNLQDMIHSNKVIKAGLHQTLANDSVHSLALSHQESVPEKTSGKLPAIAATTSALPPVVSPTSIQESGSEQVSQLYKKILLLSNDLAFERYMKQQHMAHIGELKRRQLKEAATEAETQNLILINRNLRNRLEEAKRSELRAKKESDNRRNLSKKWETDLSTKLKTLREEQKKWNSEGAALKRELDTKTQECEKLSKMLCAYETTDLNSQQNLQAVNEHVEEIARLKAEVNRFVELEATYQAKEKLAEERFAAAAESISRAEMLRMKLAARDTEMQEARKLYEAQIADLQVNLREALQQNHHHGRTRLGSGGGGNDGSAEKDPGALVEGTLAASRAKMAELQRQHDMLLRKYTALQSSLLDMMTAKNNNNNSSGSTTAANTIGGNGFGLAGAATLVSRSQQQYSMPGASDSSDAEVSAIVQGGDLPSPVRRRSTRGRGFSDPELFVEGTKYNVTPPLEALTSAPSASSLGTVIRRPSTPGSGMADSGGSGVERSPSERYFGRGKCLSRDPSYCCGRKSLGLAVTDGFSRRCAKLWAQGEEGQEVVGDQRHEKFCVKGSG